MNITYVCFLCRQRIASRQQQLRRASFVSLEGLIPETHPNEFAGGTTQRVRKSPSSASNKPYGGPSRPIPPYQSHPQSPGTDKILETLFTSNQQESCRPWNLRYSHARLGYSGNQSLSFNSTESALEAWKRMLYKEHAPIEDLWEQCLKVIQTNAWRLTTKENMDEGNAFSHSDVFRDFLLAVCRIRSQEPLRSSIPTPKKVIEAYMKQRLMENWWSQVLWIQIGVLVNRNFRVSRESRTAESFISESDVHLLYDILNVWEIFLEIRSMQWQAVSSQKKPVDPLIIPNVNSTAGSTAISSKNMAESWRGIPRNSDLQHLSELSNDLSHRFHYFFSMDSHKRQLSPIAGAATLTCHCIRSLESYSVLSKSLLQYAKPFLRLIDHLALKGKLVKKIWTKCLLEQGISAEVCDAVISEKSWKPDQSASFCKDLTGALERSDVGLAISVWHQFTSRPKPDNIQEWLLERIMHQFISTFFSLRRSELAIEVWNYMVSLGHHPNQKHWHAMIVGCVKTKDLTSLRIIWANMKAVGFEPDIISWTTWIHGLIRCGAWQSGLEALEELGGLWGKKPSTKKTDGAHEPLVPSIIPINAAITAFQSINKADVIPHILQWASSQNVYLNTSTYNIILHPIARNGEPSDIDNLLSSMQKHNCAPDVRTLTIILNGLLSNPKSAFHDQSPAEQKSTILSILDDMQQKGLAATAHTYTTILDSLLSERAANLSAARVVLDHMNQRNVKPSPHIYTILCSHYFSASPPDLPALDALWRRTRAEKGVLDPVFYDRMIEGYARIGEVEKMLFFLKRAPIEGKSPGWLALGAVLRALRGAQEWNLIRDLVADVLDRKEGVLRHGEGGSMGKKSFWEMVEELVKEGVVEY